MVCAAGGLPGELHKLWRASKPGGYHLEYGYSCMGYEIAGGLGVRLARAGGEVFVMVGDGSYLMLNSELQSSVMMGKKLIVTVLDNGGFGCINRLQQACGGAAFNNLWARRDGGFRGACAEPGVRWRSRWTGVGGAGVGFGARAAAGADVGDRDLDRPDGDHAGRRGVVGRGGAGGVGAERRCSGGARRV